MKHHQLKLKSSILIKCCFNLIWASCLKDIHTTLKKFGSNIIFSNGLLDPWSGGRWYIIYSVNILAIMFYIFPRSYLWEMLSNSNTQIVSGTAFCRIYLKVLFHLSLKKVKTFIILKLLISCCMYLSLLFCLVFHTCHCYNYCCFGL